MPLTATDVRSLVRENILKLTPYSSARSEFKGKAEVLMDANESPFDTGINRYPHPKSPDVRARLAELKGVNLDQLMLGNGSDDLVDFVTRIFCRPGIDNVIALPPTFGMYKVSAAINDVEFRAVPLTPDFDIPMDKLMAQFDENSKVLWLCSPNNPSGNLMQTEKIEYLLEKFPGVVVLDEAYIEYIPERSFLPRLNEFPNLIITQTLSKAWGVAGIRLGAAYASPFIIKMMNGIKAPYNINVLTQQRALEILADEQGMRERITFLMQAREELAAALQEFEVVDHVFPSVTNFILVRFQNSDRVYQHLLEHGIVVRNQSKQPNCANCLRITVGTAEENARFLEVLSALNQL
ncbi:histidinol-phosphate transaminase [Lewinellaceae bacterium SD302]|nr:histidinol-phosphate transaminase [Lewinellaceae bacterium SD302]